MIRIPGSSFYFLIFLSLIGHKGIFQIKIGLLFAFFCNFPFFHLIQVREEGVCLIGKVNLGHMGLAAVGKPLAVNTVAANDIHIFGGYFPASLRASSML